MKLAICLLCLFLVPVNVDAAVIERDWKAPGDGLLTYDTDNKREWLDLSQTLLFQFSGTVSERVAEAIAETAPEGCLKAFHRQLLMR